MSMPAATTVASDATTTTTTTANNEPALSPRKKLRSRRRKAGAAQDDADIGPRGTRSMSLDELAAPTTTAASTTSATNAANATMDANDIDASSLMASALRSDASVVRRRSGERAVTIVEPAAAAAGVARPSAKVSRSVQRHRTLPLNWEGEFCKLL